MLHNIDTIIVSIPMYNYRYIFPYHISTKSDNEAAVPLHHLIQCYLRNNYFTKLFKIIAENITVDEIIYKIS